MPHIFSAGVQRSGLYGTFYGLTTRLGRWEKLCSRTAGTMHSWHSWSTKSLTCTLSLLDWRLWGRTMQRAGLWQEWYLPVMTHLTYKTTLGYCIAPRTSQARGNHGRVPAGTVDRASVDGG